MWKTNRWTFKALFHSSHRLFSLNIYNDTFASNFLWGKVFKCTNVYSIFVSERLTVFFWSWRILQYNFISSWYRGKCCIFILNSWCRGGHCILILHSGCKGRYIVNLHSWCREGHCILIFYSWCKGYCIRKAQLSHLYHSNSPADKEIRIFKMICINILWAFWPHLAVRTPIVGLMNLTTLVDGFIIFLNMQPVYIQDQQK